MDSAALATRIEAERDRFAGTDAERRAAVHCTSALRAIGRSPRTQTPWFRPQRDAPRALHALLGIAGSVVCVDHHPTGLALAAAALVLSLLEAAGLPLAALPFPRRATQNVLAPPIDDPPGAVRLVLTAAADTRRASIVGRVAGHARGTLVPGPAGVMDVALLAVAACAGARLAGAGGTALGIVQLVPTAVLILLLGGWVEAAMSSRPVPGDNG